MNKIISFNNELFDRRNYTEIIFNYDIVINYDSIIYILETNIGLPIELNKIIADHMKIIDNTKIAINILFCNKFPFNFPHYPPELVLTNVRSNTISKNALIEILLQLNKNIQINWIIENSDFYLKSIIDKFNFFIYNNINDKNNRSKYV